jgi:hypothetical protein
MHEVNDSERDKVNAIQRCASDTFSIHSGHENDQHFDSTNTLVHTLRRAIAHRQDVRIALPKHGDVVVLPARGEWFYSGDSFADFCAARAADYVVSCLTAGESDHCINSGIGRNIDELMWCAGFYASKGLLIESCQQTDVVEFRHWPNLTRLPITPNTLAITALLTRYPTSPVIAARLLKISWQEIAQVYTAAFCAGLAVVINRKTELPKLEPHKNRTLLSQLLSRIAGM